MNVTWTKSTDYDALWFGWLIEEAGWGAKAMVGASADLHPRYTVHILEHRRHIWVSMAATQSFDDAKQIAENMLRLGMHHEH